jgi:two-component system response regulator HydG
LQEAELFGYAKGAFTGAVAATPGVFEAAHRGTLFLDEVGDLSLTAQTKILRALQEGEIKRLGETRTREVDVRILAATHRDLKSMIEQRAFRDDLFYRLSVVTIRIPPLRDRDNDALLLADRFLRFYAKRFAKPCRGLTRMAKQAIAEHDWPGNVRELQNAIERAVILAPGELIDVGDLAGDVARAAERGVTAAELAAIADPKERIKTAIRRASGNREVAARALGVSRTTLWRRMKELNLLGYL